MDFYIWGAHWCHLANTCTTEPSVYGGDVALCQITLTTCYYYLSVPTPKRGCCGLQKIEKINYSYWIRPVKIMSEWVQVLAQPGCSGSKAIKRVVVVIIIIALLLCWVRLCKYMSVVYYCLTGTHIYSWRLQTIRLVFNASTVCIIFLFCGRGSTGEQGSQEKVSTFVSLQLYCHTCIPCVDYVITE